MGLHPRDIDHLIAILHRLRDHGNSVLVVEHDPAVIRAADWIVDIGPGAGYGGGKVVFSGRLDDLLHTDTATSRALNNQVATPRRGRRTFDDAFRIENATSHNLRNLCVRIPKGVLMCVTGVAGSSKSSLVAELIDTLRRRPAGGGRGGEVVVVDQRPVGHSSRSNPATYFGVFDPIRRAFAAANRVSPALFSFDARGSCAKCKGRGFLEVELSFLDDVRLDCKVCKGKRYRDDVLKLTYHGRSIHDVLEMTVADALGFFASVESQRKRSSSHRARPAVPGRCGRRLSAPRPVACRPSRAAKRSASSSPPS